MSIIIRKRKLKTKEVSLYFDVCVNGSRYSIFPKIRLVAEKGLKEREYNKGRMEYAERLKAKIWDEILNSVNGLPVKSRINLNFFNYLDDYLTTQKSGKSIISALIKKLRTFHKNNTLFSSEIDSRFLERFYDYLEKTCNNETPITYFKRLQRILKEATKEKIFQVNPGLDIKNRKFKNKQRDILLSDDLVKLNETFCPNLNVKEAFLLCCVTGFRFSDIKQLKWSNIQENKIVIYQQKTKELVTVLLNNDALHILKGRPKISELVFQLPSHRSCLINLEKWVRNAGIKKQISWHNSRHTFGSNLLFTGTDIYTASKLLGHKSLVHTQRYVRESDNLKNIAVNNLPKIFK